VSDPAASKPVEPRRPVADKAERALTPMPPRQPPGEVNGPRGPEPTRFGDWEKNGRCSDF
jgi:hypothetical protein